MADGTPDPSFNVTNDFTGGVWAVAAYRDDSVLIGGDMVSAARPMQKHFVRLLGDGSVDDTFANGGGFDNRINFLAVQPDGKIVGSGNFTNVNSKPRPLVARLNSDGTLDQTFNPGSASGGLYVGTIIEPDRRITVCVGNSMINRVAISGVARFNGDSQPALKLLLQDGQPVVTWPSSYWKYELETQQSLGEGDWSAVNAVSNNLFFNHTNDATGAAMFFRLRERP